MERARGSPRHALVEIGISGFTDGFSASCCQVRSTCSKSSTGPALPLGFSKHDFFNKCGLNLVIFCLVAVPLHS